MILAASGASLALAFQLGSLDSKALLAFLSDNQLKPGQRSLLLVSMLASAAAPIVVALGWLGYSQRARRRAHPGRSQKPLQQSSWGQLHAVSLVACPLVLAGALPALFNWPFGQQNKLEYLVLLLLVLASLEPLLSRCLQACKHFTFSADLRQWLPTAPGLLQRLPIALVVLAASAYALHFSYYSIVHHQALGTSAFDLGIFDNTLFSALHGAPFHSTVMNGTANVNILSCHAEYAMLAFLPLYALWPHAEMLLVLQAVFLGAAAIPLYFLARKRLGEALAVVLALAYLLNSPLHGANFYDFHWLPLAIPFLFALFLAIAGHHHRRTIALTIILFSLREDIPLGLAVLGCTLVAVREYRRVGLWLASASVVFFVINKFAVMPSFGKWWFQNIYKELFADGGTGYGSVVKTLLSNPLFTLKTTFQQDKLIYALHMLVPLALLPVRRLGVALLLLPGCFFTLLTTAYAPTVSIAFQYTAHWIPYLFLGTIVVLDRVGQLPDGKNLQRAAAGALCLGVLSHSYNFGAVLQHDSFRGGFRNITFVLSPTEQARYEAVKRLAALIPPEASVASTETLTPHVSNRIRAYPFRFPLKDAEYILVRKSDLSKKGRKFMQDALNADSYHLLSRETHGLFLFEQGPQDDKTRSALRELRLRPPSHKPKPAGPTSVRAP